MARATVEQAGSINVLAFLDTIAYSELKPWLIDASDDGYNVLVGSLPGAVKLFHSYAGHPRQVQHITIHHADGSSTEVASSAAGRYQIIYPTFVPVREKLHLLDFSPISQDRAAIELIRGRGALPDIARGGIERAITLCNPEWASFPGAGYNQHENHMTDLLNAYELAHARYA